MNKNPIYHESPVNLFDWLCATQNFVCVDMNWNGLLEEQYFLPLPEKISYVEYDLVDIADKKCPLCDLPFQSEGLYELHFLLSQYISIVVRSVFCNVTKIRASL